MDGRVARRDFKAVALDAASGGHPLVARGVMLAERLDLLCQLDIPRDAFARFLLVLERAHPRQNPFHGAVHAALTVHAMDELIVGKDWRINSLSFFLCCVTPSVPPLRNPQLLS